MKNRSFKDIVMIVCAGLLIAAFGIVLLRAGTKTILVDKLHKDNSFVKIVLKDNPELLNYPGKKAAKPAPKPAANKGKQPAAKAVRQPANKKPSINWAKLYPFPKEKKAALQNTRPAKPSASGNKDRIVEFDKKIKAAEKSIDAWTNKNFFHYMSMINLANAYQKYIGWNISLISGYNTVVELPDGQWVHFNFKRNMTPLSKSVIDLSAFCKKQNIKFLTVLAPGKIARTEKAFSGTLDFSNQNGDEFIRQLRKAGIRCLDLRDHIVKDGLNQRSLFYRTDHHWQAWTGRWAAGKILNELNKHYGYHADISLLEDKKYTEKKYDSLYLGSSGKKVTTARAKPDDFIVYLPKFKTNFQIEIPSEGLKKNGDFSVLYNMGSLKRNAEGYSLDAYRAYGHGDKPLLSIHNRLKKDKKKLLFVRDSFSDTIIPFAALGMEHLSALDLRQFRGSLQTYLKKNKPDTLILVYWIEDLNQNGINLKKHTDLFDFR